MGPRLRRRRVGGAAGHRVPRRHLRLAARDPALDDRRPDTRAADRRDAGLVPRRQGRAAGQPRRVGGPRRAAVARRRCAVVVRAARGADQRRADGDRRLVARQGPRRGGFRRRRSGPLHRRPALREPQPPRGRRVLRRRHPRRHPHAALQSGRTQGHLAHLGGEVPRHEPVDQGDRRPARRHEPPRRRRAAGGRPRAHQRAAHRRGERRAPVGRELRPGAHRRQHLRHPERGGGRDRRRAQGDADRRREGTGERGADPEPGSLGELPARAAASREAHQHRAGRGGAVLQRGNRTGRGIRASVRGAGRFSGRQHRLHRRGAE